MAQSKDDTAKPSGLFGRLFGPKVRIHFPLLGLGRQLHVRQEPFP